MLYCIKAAAFNKHDGYYQFRYFVRDIFTTVKQIQLNLVEKKLGVCK